MPYKDKDKQAAWFVNYRLQHRDKYLSNRLKNKERDKATRKLYNSSPRGRYQQQRRQAVLRNIPWEFTFETWWKVWEDSGKWEERGFSKGKYCMCRSKDVGPYSPSNVVVATTEDNKKRIV